MLPEPGRPGGDLHAWRPWFGLHACRPALFRSETFRVVPFDQRGSGRSRPLASEPGINLSTNTTAHLIADIEQLRRLHGIDKWTVLGISRGATLGLAYAQTHPQHAYGKPRGATIRRDLIDVADSAARHGRGHITLHLPAGWHHETEWMNLFAVTLTSPDPVTASSTAATGHPNPGLATRTPGKPQDK